MFLISTVLVLIGAYFTWRNLRHFVDRHPTLSKHPFFVNAPFWTVFILVGIVESPWAGYGLPNWLRMAVFAGYVVLLINAGVHIRLWVTGAFKAEHDHDIEVDGKK